MTAQFKIGSFYRDGRGNVVRVDEVVGQITATRLREFYGDYGLQVSYLSGNGWLHYGWRRATDGAHSDDGPEYSLLPGELHNVNGAWVPLGVAEEAPKTASLETKVSFDKTTGRTIYEPVYRPLDVPPFSVRVGAAEKVRPPLTWATPKPVDRWEGFTVRYDTGAQLADDNNHPLQRMTDPSDPLHGSAFLRKG